MPYSIEEHKHRFAAWAAATAASVKGCRFAVQQGNEVLEAAGMKKVLRDADRLPAPERMDATHRQWRHRVVKAAEEIGLQFSHGIAAKLLNVYLKAGFVCAGCNDHPSVRALHPPIDSVLLETLCEKNAGGLRDEWIKAKRARWSKFTSDQYEAVIKSIRQTMADAPLWGVEEHWQGYRPHAARRRPRAGM
jgi:hypothetical protein